MTTVEEAIMIGRANLLVENNLSSVEITHKVDTKTGKEKTEWCIKCKHEDPKQAMYAAQQIDDDLACKYVKED